MIKFNSIIHYIMISYFLNHHRFVDVSFLLNVLKKEPKVDNIFFMKVTHRMLI